MLKALFKDDINYAQEGPNPYKSRSIQALGKVPRVLV